MKVIVLGTSEQRQAFYKHCAACAKKIPTMDFRQSIGVRGYEPDLDDLEECKVLIWEMSPSNEMYQHFSQESDLIIKFCIFENKVTPEQGVTIVPVLTADPELAYKAALGTILAKSQNQEPGLAKPSLFNGHRRASSTAVSGPGEPISGGVNRLGRSLSMAAIRE